MQFKYLVFSFFFAILFVATLYAGSPKIHYFPVGELTLCKGCGHSHSDYWRANFRLENLSDEDLILYGNYYEGKFSPSGMIQRRNPDLCEWQYGNGKNKDIEWSKKSSLDKEVFVLKSKQSIESEAGFIRWDFNKPTRFSFYSSSKAGEEPTEVFSDAFSVTTKPIRDEQGKLLDYEKPEFSSVNDSCDPHCKLSIEQSPKINGIQLGMSLEDFKKINPKSKISKSKEKNYNIKWAYIWDWNTDAYNTSADFLDDKIVRIETKFRSLKDTRIQDNLFLIVADKLGLASFWTPYSSTFECQNFLVDVLPNENPTITIWNKSFIEIRDKINEEELKRKR